MRTSELGATLVCRVRHEGICGSRGLASCFDRFVPGIVSRYPSSRRLGDPTAGLDVFETRKSLVSTGNVTSDRPALSLYRLR